MASSNNRKLVPEAKDALDKFKMEAANEVGVKFHQRKYRLSTTHTIHTANLQRKK